MSDIATLPMQSSSFPYQLMPSLSADEYASLKADIALRGVLVPVEKDEAGNVLDGHHRVQICEKLGDKNYPVVFRLNLSEAEKRAHVRSLNLSRRHLTQAQRRELIAEQLKETPEKSDRQVASVLGVDHKTVGSLREDLEATGEIPQLDKTIGADGKARPRTVLARNDREAEAVLDMFPKMNTETLNTDKTLYVKDVHKEVRAQDRAELAAMLEPSLPSDAPVIVNPGEWWRLGNHLLFCGDSSSAEFRDKAPACPFAFADPPYNVGKAEWDDAFKWRHDWLSDSAEVVAVTPGISEFHRFFTAVQMPYKWTFTAWIKNGMTRGEMGFGNTLLALLFSHGSIHRAEQDFMQLVVETGTTGDTLHPSRKPLPFVARLMQIYSAEGDSVIDPFLGSGTTLWAAEELGRNAYVAELSPAYCGEVIGRWQAMTGKTAVKQ